MTERALLVKAAVAPGGAYAVAGMEFAKLRVFDTAAGIVCGQFAADNALHVRLSAVAVAPTTRTALAADSTVVAVAGTATGRVIAYDASAAAPLFDVAVATATDPITAVAVAGGHVYAATATHLAVLDAVTGEARVRRVPIGRGCSALAVAEVASADGPATSVVLTAGAASSVSTMTVAAHVDGSKLSDVCGFTGHAAAPDYAWLSPAGELAVTAVFGEGVVRVWDVRPGRKGDRGRRTLPCGSRIASVHVDTATATVTAVTVTGIAHCWRLRSLEPPATSDPVPLRPTCSLTSSDPRGRILAVTPAPAGGALLSRGSWAMPQFDALEAERFEEACRVDGVAPVGFVPMAKALRPADHGDHNAARLAHTLSAKRVKGPAAKKLAQPLAVVGARSFDAPRLDRAEDMAALPVEVEGGAATGLAIPLAQALHANDAPLVSELLAVAARTPTDVVATVKALQPQALLQLLAVLAEKLPTASLRSPFHAWVHAALKHRGPELKAYQPPEGHATAAAVLAPLLHHFRRLTPLQAGVAVAFGRSSVFNAVRPAKKAAAFPHVFEEPARAVGRFEAIGGGEDGEEDEESDILSDASSDVHIRQRPSRRGGAKHKRRQRNRRERLLAEGDADSDDMAALDDAESDAAQGDDGSSAFGSGDEAEEGEESLGDLDDMDLDELGSGEEGEEDEDEDAEVGAAMSSGEEDMDEEDDLEIDPAALSGRAIEDEVADMVKRPGKRHMELTLPDAEDE